VLAEKAREDVGAAARRKRHDDADGSRLRPRAIAGERKQKERDAGGNQAAGHLSVLLARRNQRSD
jgi:hypothetical protein